MHMGCAKKKFLFPSNLKLSPFEHDIYIYILMMPMAQNSDICWTTGLKACKVGKDCLGAHGVLRVSMGCFVSFFKFQVCAYNLVDERTKHHINH